MPPAKRYCSYLEPGTTSKDVPRQTVWSQQKKARQATSALAPSQSPPTHDDSTSQAHDDSTSQRIDANDGGVDLSPEDATLEGPCAADDDPDADLAEFIRTNSEKKLPNQTTSLLQAILLVLTFVAAAGLTWTQVDGLLKLLNALFGQDIFPTSKYGLRKLWDLQRSKAVEVHPYCPACLHLTTSCGESKERCSVCAMEATLPYMLRKGNFFITLDLKQQLLKLLKNTADLVGRSLQKIASTTDRESIEDLTDGELYKNCRTKNKLSWSDLTVTMNSDGSPVFKSSKGSLWPIQVALNELPVPHRWKNVLVGAVWFAKEHPPSHLFLKTFVDKFNAIDTLVWTFAGRTMRSTVNAICCCVDSPARAALLNAKQYNGYYGCSWCFQKGTLIDGTLKYIYEGPDMVERCHESVVSAMKLASTRGCPVDGVKGPSAVANLRTLDLVWGFPTDYLHCILEGVVSQLMELWLSSTGKAWYIGNRIGVLNDRILKIRPPGFFTRLPRSLSERSFWKATEWKYWLLYYGVPCLENILPHKYLLHFSLLAHSTYLLLKASIKQWEISHANNLLKQFVSDMPKLYGENTFTFNVHQLVHIAKSVQMTGPLWATSTFPFEGGNGDLLKLVSAAKGVPQQIAERCIMQEMLKSLERIVFLPPVLKKKQLIISGKKTVNRSVSAVMGAPLPSSSLEVGVSSLLISMSPVPTFGQYSRAQIRGFTVHSSHYKRAEKSCSEYIETCDGRLCKIVNILSINGTVALVCQELLYTESIMPSLYEVEHPPPDVGLCLVQEESIFSVCVYVEQNGKSFIAKIPNLYEKD